MGTEKRQRQKEGRQARIAAAEQARRKAGRRRLVFSALKTAGAIALLSPMVLWLIAFVVVRRTRRAGLPPAAMPPGPKH